ncbi:hypothetical protein [Pseudonocardia spirodelae]|uniref:Integral membrane protein n=1 Tax=Pseudonocardia spirodelae TaxID=3133431 RepID=A0ABU8TDV7_9PSEU
MATESTSPTVTDPDTATTDSAPTTGTGAAATEPTTGPAGEPTTGTAATADTPESPEAARTPASGTADTAPERPVTGAAGAGAVVAAGLGLASLTGTSVGDMLREREQLVGQIQAATGSPGDSIESFYGAPWDVAATVNGVVALLAVLVGLVLVLGPASRPGTGAWVRPVALGGLVLGVLGLLVSGGMYLDLFAAQPTLPAMPGLPGLGG